MIFAGPSPESILEMGQKHKARDMAISANVPVVPGTSLLSSADEAVGQSQRTGFPVMLKSTGGGGGMGLQVCQDSDEVTAAFEKVQSRGQTLFNNASVFLERY